MKTNLKTKALAYWTTTLILTAELIAGGVLDLAHTQSVVATLDHLGYPTYLLYIVGTWRLLAAAALLAPGLPRLKEWAYAGAFFELTGAALSSLAVGDGLGAVVTPSLFAACALASWALRPPSRTLKATPEADAPRPAESPPSPPPLSQE